ncbi:MAG: hypothetical protein C4533_05720 [Candidatus Omnitrophota bacterium]|jgi:uncharacterized repeat protein (TIGR04138 family)|nr:MAG: hypothetical protein C4533_05720 [Candidatus Omnitrophota bacterium]
MKKKNFYKLVEEICSADPRYKPESYEFVIHALHFTQKKLKESGHVSGRELLGGIKDYAIEQFGPLAKNVLNHWGILKTDDFGNIVYNMIKKKMLSRRDEDSLEDFKKVYDFDVVFADILRSSVIKQIKELEAEGI